MAHPDGTSARAHRVIGLAASVLLAVTTALAFGRVFVGGGAGSKLIAVAIASAGLAVVFERRSLLLATITSSAGVAVAVGLVVFPDTIWYGLPTADTLRAALDAAGAVGEQARLQVAPAEPIAPLLLAAVVSLWASVFSAHALAFRAGSPLLGLVPPVALVAFADTVLEQFVKPLYGWAFLVAALLVVFVDGLARVQGWGPVWSSSRGGVAITAGRGARRLAGTALVAALVAPIIVPGFGSKAVIDFGARGEGRVTVDPFVAVTSQLKRSSPVTVLEFTSPEPTYLRLVSLPNFDGEGWRPDPEAGQPLGEGGVVPNLSSLLPGGIPEASAEPVGVRIVTDLGFAWIPTPYPVRSIQAGDSTVTYDPATGTAFAEPALREGDAYALSATFATPSAEELRSIPDSPGFGEPGGGDRYLALPPDLNPEIEEIAKAWTANEDSVFDRAFAIQKRLSAFEYDENFEVGDGPDAILTFLTETKAGFCQQFAASMALMLRTLDIPARVVVGFGSGRAMRGGGYEVSSDRLHAWVEVNFQGFGWMPFEPTPRRENPAVEAYTAPSVECSGRGCDDGSGGGASGANTENSRSASQGDLRPTGPRGREGGAGSVTLPSETSRISARLFLLIAVILGGVGFLLLPVVRAVRRRIAVGRAAGEPRRSILVTYEHFTERAGGMGLARARGETFDEYRRKVLETGYLSNGQLDRLTRIATAAAYSPRDPDQGDARAASEAAGTALTEIRRGGGRARGLVGLYRR